jgi:hypothetical protein
VAAVGELERGLEDIAGGVEYPEMFARKILSLVQDKHVPNRPRAIDDDDLQIDHYEKGRRHTVVMAHRPSGVVVEYESMLDRQDAEEKARALLVA